MFLPEGSRVTVQALTRFFEILGEANVPPLQLGAQLARIAGDYVELKTRLRSVRADDPTVAALREEAASLIEAGEFETARARLGAAVARSRDIRKEFEARARESRALEATTEAELGDLAKLRLAYREAATHYATACDLVRDDAPEAALRYALRQAGALYDQGNEFGDNGALKDAIALYRDAVLSLNTPPTRPLDWAGTQNNLGIALSTLGKRESGTQRLEQAVDAFKVALEELTRERVPLDWATTQNNLGTALLREAPESLGASAPAGADAIAALAE